jgi:nitrite reductase (NO-forming)
MHRFRSRLSKITLLALAVAVLGACDSSPRPATSSPATPAAAPAASAPAAAASGTPAAAASKTTEGADDGYDVAKMDFKPGPAKVGTTRHTGPFASGSALSLDAMVKPLVPDPVKEVHLDTTHKIIELAPGISFSAWTFGDQVPGPVIRARVGDRIKFSMTNRSDEPAPGIQVMAAPMMHSMDFHAAMVSPQDKYRSIAPGQTIDFEFTPNYPGVYMYHCGTPMVLEHIASGMYGMMIVEPRGGYPTKVDREYAVVQSEFYTKLDPQRRKVGGQPLYVLDGERVRTKAPTYTVFNGRYNGMVDHPLEARPGERVRLFVLNVGPSNTSSFHVVGTIFDRVWLEGNPDNQLRGSQTVLLGSSNSAIVEFVIPEAGSYVMVDHHFANASQGAVGLIAAGEVAGGGESEHHNIPATAAPTDPLAVRGKLSFESKCLACHSIGGGDKLGPDVYGVTKRQSEAWLTRWLKSPDAMLKSDADAKALLDKYKVPMPDQNLSDQEIREFIAYFKWADANLQIKGTQQPQQAAPGTALQPNQTLSGSPGAVGVPPSPNSPTSVAPAPQQPPREKGR